MMEPDNPANDLYKECLRNHAASLGSYATDGCGEFTVDDTAPSSFQCGACGCHRNFHRKVTYTVTEAVDYGGRRVESGGEGGIRAKRYRTKFTGEQKEKMLGFAEKLGWKLRRKEKEEDEVERFCRGIGISRQVFKVWMHNHKNLNSSSSIGNASSSLTTQ